MTTRINIVVGHNRVHMGCAPKTPDGGFASDNANSRIQNTVS